MKNKKIITKCSDCGSGCIWYRPDATILCTACMTVMDKDGKIITPGRKADK
jgi:ribosomal protein S27E